MKGFLILCLAFIMSCTATPSQKSSEMQKNAEIFISESQGGGDEANFTIIRNEQELQKAIKGNSRVVDLGKEAVYPQFPKDKKVVLYNLGMFNSGDHKITHIKNISVKDNVLYVEVPQYQSGGMEIQVMSNPWFIFTVPSDYQFTSVELKYSK
ncbi:MULTISPECIES: hypothetical protein [Chryseobacterium]|uniref:Lipoprotein n=1 Tax=Chryseobacterium geocarposphaerae TaxID=1416776 RepID=A0ABU1LAV7_9FLAO|nr:MULTISPECIES: hypothetical protein [Chryseobacterium]MDR6403745.1 hypothetical protein [Chryseobacterium geocarposphaerae]MDR6697299.1 hypothetical protein [Chryseobacterium ginsenosidimutans]